MAYLAITGVLAFCVAIARLWSRRWVNAVTAFSGIWLASLVSLGITSESSPAHISWQAALIVITVHLAFTSSYCIFYLPGKRAGTKTHETIEKVQNNDSMTFWLYWFCASFATVGVVLLIHAVFSKETLGPLVLLAARDDLTKGLVVLPLGGRILSNFCYPAAVLGPVVGLRSRTWKGYLLMALPLVILLGLSLVSGGRGPLLIGFCLTGWVVLASDSSDRSRIKAKRALAVAACVTVVYFMLIAELRSNMKAGSGLAGVTTYLRTPLPSFSAWLQTASPPIINLDLTYLAPVREVLVRSGGKQLRDVDSLVVYVPYPYNVFTALAEHCISFGLVGMVIVWICLGAGVALLESSETSPFRPALLSVAYTYLTYSLICDLAFLVTGWLLAVVLIVGLALCSQLRLQQGLSLSCQPK